MRTNTPNLSRRTLLAATPAAAILPATYVQAPHPDAELIRLADEFVLLEVEMIRLVELAGDCAEAGDEAGELAAEEAERPVAARMIEISSFIVATPARTLAGLRAKALAQRADADKQFDNITRHRDADAIA